MATINDYKLVAVKIGSSLLVDEDTGCVRQTWLSSLASDLADLLRSGTQIVIISSGAIALGRERLDLGEKSLSLAQKQACAAIGQAQLISAYADALAPHELVAAQALLTLNDTEDRRRWINAKATITTLLELGAIPIINENDTIATDEIRYGDNDRLAARVAQMIGADLLVLLSDVDGLYDKDPSQNAHAAHIPLIENITPEIMAMGGGANQMRGTGSGGMATKLLAAKIATQSGCALVIAKGNSLHPLRALMNETTKSSWFTAITSPQKARKQWIAGALATSGKLHLDDGALAALRKGKSLLSAGVVAIKGEFDKGEPVLICTQDGHETGKGLTSYNAEDARKIMGLKSSDIEDVLGYDGGAALIHRDNLVLSS